jgi:exosortase
MLAQSPPARLPEWRDLNPAAVVAGSLLALSLLWAYAANFLDLGRRWINDPNYTHGFLVVPIALAILWQRRDILMQVSVVPSLWGWVALGGVLAVRVYLYDRNEQWLEAATFPLAVAALSLALLGWRIAWRILPAVVFLWLMLPLPPAVNTLLAEPLQTLATIGSTALLQVMGLPVVSEGHVILIGAERLEVAQACNGLSMLLSFVTLISATALLARSRPLRERIVLLVSTIPIALISNILRIAATAWAYHLLGAKTGEKIAHNTAGWLMMPIALALCWLELKLLSWLIIEEEQAPRSLYIPPTPTRPVAKKSKPGDSRADAEL